MSSNKSKTDESNGDKGIEATAKAVEACSLPLDGAATKKILPEKSTSGSTKNPPMQSGSATGNPRNKVALRPGHSLMDWVRLGNSGVDLTGVGGMRREVTATELANHNSEKDIWIAIKGRVYNVTRYLDFHPGGVEELMRGAGKDATKLFDDVHAWVNHEQILQKCYVGPLKGKPQRSALSSLLFKRKEKSPTPTDTPAPSAGIVRTGSAPRLDWFQQMNSLTLVLYSGLVPKTPTQDVGSEWLPPWTFLQLDEAGLAVSLSIENLRGERGMKHHSKLLLQCAVNWPPQILRIHPDSGKVEAVLGKQSEGLWTRYGEPDQTADSPKIESMLVARVLESETVARNFSVITVEISSRSCFTLPVGAHVRVSLSTEPELSDGISRSYTPIGSSTLCGPDPAPGQLVLMIKGCGPLSNALCNLKIGDQLLVSTPIPRFDSRRATSACRLLLLAAGSGITPMIRLISLVLGDSRKICSLVQLIFFNRTVSDIPWREQFAELAKKDARFQIEHVLSEPDSEWTGQRGLVSADLIHRLVESSSQPDTGNTLACVCGPDSFTNETRRLLLAEGLTEEQMHCFLG